MSSIYCNLVVIAVIVENLVFPGYDVGNRSNVFSAFVAISGYSALNLIQNASRDVMSNILCSPLPSPSQTDMDDSQRT